MLTLSLENSRDTQRSPTQASEFAKCPLKMWVEEDEGKVMKRRTLVAAGAVLLSSLLAAATSSKTTAGRSVMGEVRSAVVVAQVSPTPQPAKSTLAPVLVHDARDVIPGEYIIAFKSGSGSAVESATTKESLAAQELARRLGGTVGHVYRTIPVGFSAKLPDAALQAVRAAPGVDYVEPNKKVSIASVQLNPPTGLDRTSERSLALDARYTYTETGAGVHAYVIDTGVMRGHTDFGGRAGGAWYDALGGAGDDCHGHGTHVAGTIGGATYGIAKNVQLHPVRVLNCAGNGTEADAAAGVEWVSLNRVAGQSVANMSLGAASPLPFLESKIAASIANYQVTYVLAAGNLNMDACGFSPARMPAAVTVGAIDPNTDTRPNFSNWGACLDLFAPGFQILSAWTGNGTNVLSGTSMAAPHVTGVVALYLQNHSGSLPAQVWSHIHTVTDNVFPSPPPAWPGITNKGAGSPNELLHWGSLNDGRDDGDKAPPYDPVVAELPRCTSTSAGQTVTLDVSTGTDLSGASVPNGNVDPKWALVAAPGGVALGPSYAVPSFPLPWVAATSPAKWITPWPTGGGGGGAGPTGNYQYQLRFNISNPASYSSISIGGTCHADDGATISLNGNLIPSCNGFSPTPNVTFNATSGFVPGPNVLDVNVNNIPEGSPSGLLMMAGVKGVCAPPPPPPPSIDCCAPLNKTNFGDMLSEKLGVGNINTDYAIKYHNSATAAANATFDSTMQAYFNYISSPGMDPSIKAVSVFLFLDNCGNPTPPANQPGNTVPCASSTHMPNIKVLTWNAATTGTPISGQIIPPYTSPTYALNNTSNVFDTSQVFDDSTQASHVNNLYQVAAVVALDRPSLGDQYRVEFLDKKCGIFFSQTNHMQYQKLRATFRLTGKELEQFEAGRRMLRNMEAIRRMRTGPPASIPLRGLK